jgi:excisionase family DNA binding protein
MGEWVKPAEIAELLDCNPRTVVRMVRDGRLDGRYFTSHLLRIRRESLEQLLAG